jgi:hypothetical protein
MLTAKPAWGPEYTAMAEAVWTAYQASQDLTDRAGQSAGIDPISGRVWFGESIEDVVQAMNADGMDTPLLFVRVGSDTYYRKGRR